MLNAVKNIIDKLNLKPHIEGGYYRRTYQSHLNFQESNKIRSISTTIYYLLEGDDFSSWHRLKSDEIWHFYCGSDVIIYQINDKGILSSTVLGNLLVNSNSVPQCFIQAETWFAAKVISPTSFALLGCTVSPGFEYEDFELGKKTELLKKYPQHKKIILKFIKENM